MKPLNLVSWQYHVYSSMCNAVISQLLSAAPLRPWVSADYWDFYFLFRVASVSYNDRREFALVRHGMVMVEDLWQLYRSWQCCHLHEMDESVADKGCWCGCSSLRLVYQGLRWRLQHHRCQHVYPNQSGKDKFVSKKNDVIRCKIITSCNVQRA